MNKQVFDYFENLDEQKLNRSKHIIIKDDHTTLQERLSKVDLYDINGIPVYRKPWNDEKSIITMASAKMYGDLGILTPPIYVMQNNRHRNFLQWFMSKRNIEINDHADLSTIQQDVESIKNLDCTIALSTPVNALRFELDSLPKYKWQLLYDGGLRSKFLKYMTPECLDELINMFLLDELRSDNDRHTGNYFLYKDKNLKKCTGVIPIDLENPFILFGHKSIRPNFDDFLYITYKSYTPIETLDCLSFPRRIQNIKDLLYDGALSPEQENLLKNAVAYDLPGTIKQICHTYPLRSYQKNAYEPFARLWDYNRQELGKELGL